jgi:hypothetical protein
MHARSHGCDRRCCCPVHGTPLIYHAPSDTHACQDPACEHAHGMVLTRPAYDYPLDDPRHRCVQGLCDDHAGPTGDVELLQRLEQFFLPLSPEQAAERQRASTGSGVLTRETIARLLAGEFW